MSKLSMSLAILVGIVVIILWKRSDKSKMKKLFFSIYNHSLDNEKSSGIIYGSSINILDIMNDVNIEPTTFHKLLEQLETNYWIIVRPNRIVLTAEGASYFGFKYLGKNVRRDPDDVRWV